MEPEPARRGARRGRSVRLEPRVEDGQEHSSSDIDPDHAPQRRLRRAPRGFGGVDPAARGQRAQGRGDVADDVVPGEGAGLAARRHRIGEGGLLQRRERPRLQAVRADDREHDGQEQPGGVAGLGQHAPAQRHGKGGDDEQPASPPSGRQRRHGHRDQGVLHQGGRQHGAQASGAQAPLGEEQGQDEGEGTQAEGPRGAAGEDQRGVAGHRGRARSVVTMSAL